MGFYDRVTIDCFYVPPITAARRSSQSEKGLQIWWLSVEGNGFNSIIQTIKKDAHLFDVGRVYKCVQKSHWHSIQYRTGCKSPTSNIPLLLSP